MDANFGAGDGIARAYAADVLAALDAAAIVVIMDGAGVVLDVSRRYCELSGYDRAEAIGLHFSRLEGGTGDPAAYDGVLATLRAGAVWRGEVRARRKDGSSYWALTTIVPHAGPDGQHRYVALRADITEQKRVEAAAREAERLHGTIVESLSEGIVLHEADGRIRTCNASALRILGLTMDQICGRTSTDPRWRAVREDGSDFPGDEHPAMVTLRSGQAQTGVIMGLYKPGGTLTWISINSAPVFRDGRDEPVAVVTSFSDITAQRRAQAELERHAETLEAVLDNIPIGVSLFGRDLRLLAYNKRVKEVLEFPDELFERPDVGLLDLVRYNAERGAYGGLEPQAVVQTVRTLARQPDASRTVERQLGDGRILELVGTTVPGGGFLATYADVTERRRAEALVRASEERFRSLFALSPVPLGLLDVETRRLVMGSQSLAELIEGDGGAIRDMALDRIVPDAGRAIDAARLARMKTGDRLGPVETEMVTLGGRRVPTVLSGTLIEDFDGAARLLLVAQDITSRRRYEEKLWQLANVDPLTGLPNRMQFNARLAEAIDEARRSGGALAVVLFDIDEFKEINDTFGHDAGDELLRTFARRIVPVIRTTDTIARLGGDEFAAILTDIDSAAALRRPIEAMVASLRQPVAIGGTERRCTASIGVTVYPDDALEPTDLLKNADIALYRAKAAGRDRYELFRPIMREEIRRRSAVKNDLAEALARDELSLYYQPIVAVADRSVVGHEALLRWVSPERGVLAPGQFREAFEDLGFSSALGLRVLDLALDQVARWRGEGRRFGRIGLNVTLADFRPDGLVDTFLHRLDQGVVAPADICIEVTERLFLGRGAERVGDGLARLHDRGIEIAFDDFGTGYASLTHLKRFPIDTLKIDTSFVEDMDKDAESRAIVAGIVQLAHSLGKIVVAEGVSNDEQAMLLEAVRCDRMQGYAIGRPVGAEDLFAARPEARAGGLGLAV